MKFADNLRQLRKEKDISQEALAIDLKVSRQTISKWENGSAMPDMKKLTETAEYFNTTMDELLGLSEDCDEKSSEDSSDYKQYINSMLTLLEESDKKRYNKLFKRFVIFLIVLVIAFSITVCQLVNSFNSQISDLSSRISNIQINAGNLSDHNNDDENNITSCKLLDIDKSKPYSFKAEFTYEPESYPKNADIYFLIPQRNGESKKIKAENHNDIFTLTTDIDIMAKGKYYVCIDDGKEITKEFINQNLFFEIFNTSILGSVDNTIRCNEKGKITEIAIGSSEEGYTVSNDIDFMIAKGINIEKVELIAQANDKEVLKKELRIKTPSDSNYTGQVELAPFRINLNGEVISTFCFYISFITDTGLELRYYPATFEIDDVLISKSGGYEIVCNDADNESSAVFYDEYEAYDFY